jgi:hypothetical protein
MFCDSLAADPETARQEIQKRIKKLIMAPRGTSDGTVLEVTSEIELLNG